MIKNHKTTEIHIWVILLSYLVGKKKQALIDSGPHFLHWNVNLKDWICILFFCHRHSHSHSHSVLCNVYPVALDRTRRQTLLISLWLWLWLWLWQKNKIHAPSFRSWITWHILVTKRNLSPVFLLIQILVWCLIQGFSNALFHNTV